MLSYIFWRWKRESKISKLIIDRNLQNDIILYGYKDREELNKINFMNAIGVGTLGDYRNVFLQRPSLKHREYCGRGIPFFYAGDDPDFHQDRCPFIYKVPLNNDLLDINEIIHWYRTLTITQQEIREYALKHLDWKIKIKQILDRIEM
ncbi:MAG: hypothetical protein IPO37_12745 [Saprospiraceae bacterium]|nr:hypothetical protein [Saprospiraceae bacterium]